MSELPRRCGSVLHSRGINVASAKSSAGTAPPTLRLFGSVARGDAGEDSDLDLLVDLAPEGGNELLRVAGLTDELSRLLGTRVDVVAAMLLRDEVSATALADAVAV